MQNTEACLLVGWSLENFVPLKMFPSTEKTDGCEETLTLVPFHQKSPVHWMIVQLSAGSHLLFLLTAHIGHLFFLINVSSLNVNHRIHRTSCNFISHHLTVLSPSLSPGRGRWPTKLFYRFWWRTCHQQLGQPYLNNLYIINTYTVCMFFIPLISHFDKVLMSSILSLAQNFIISVFIMQRFWSMMIKPTSYDESGWNSVWLQN